MYVMKEILDNNCTHIVDFENAPFSLRHGRYGGQAGDKDGIIYNKENWIIKYPKSTKSMQGLGLSKYTTSPLSEYIGSHIYKILGYDVHDTLLGIRNNQIVVACKDFQKHMGDLAEIRTIKNAANKQLQQINDGALPESATGDKVILEELFLHFEKNPLLQSEGIKERFWECVIVDILIGNNDRNNGNWGLLLDEEKQKYVLSPIYDNGNSFNNKTSDERIQEYLNENDNSRILGERTIYTYQNKLLSAKNILQLDNADLEKAIETVVPKIKNSMENIKSFIDGIPVKYNNLIVCSDVRKEYYKKTIEIRYDLLLSPLYEQVIKKEGQKNELD